MAGRSPLINVMVRAAEKAAKGLVRDFGEVENLQVSRKGPADFVSVADTRAEGIVREELAKARPDFGFLMEESGATKGKEEARWIVDPLDGTTNFLHGLPCWGISIALEREGEIVAGIVYEPVHDEMFWAEKGQGAFLNNKRLRVSERRRLDDSVIATGIPFKGREETHPRFLKELAVLMKEVAGIRRWGAASVDLAFLAAGRWDGFWERGLNPWDCAAGILLVMEAGGFVSEIGGGRNPVYGGSLVAANAHLHLPLASLLRSTSEA